MKQGDKGIVKTWKKRWFSLKESRLYYYNSEGESVPTGFIDLKGAYLQEPGDPNKSNDFGLKFQIVVDKRTYRLKVEESNEVANWLRVISAAIAKYSPEAPPPRQSVIRSIH